MTFGSTLVVLICLGSQPAVGQDAATPAPSTVGASSADAPSAEVGADAPETSEVARPDSESDPVAVSDGDADLDAVTERLLGDGPILPASPTSSTAGPVLLPDTPSWMWPVGLLMLAAIVALRWQTQRPSDSSTRIQVIHRTALGREGHLAMIEVGEDDDRRRLLIGYGSGAPRLVAELDVPEFATASPRPEAPSAVPAAQRWQRALRRLGVQGPSTTSGTAPRGPAGASKRTGGEGSAAARTANGPEARLQPRRSLVEEVLAERGPAVEPPEGVELARSAPPPPVVNEEAAGEDQENKEETYTFRGLIG